MTRIIVRKTPFARSAEHEQEMMLGHYPAGGKKQGTIESHLGRVPILVHLLKAGFEISRQCFELRMAPAFSLALTCFPPLNAS